MFLWSRLGDLNPGPTHYEGVSASLSFTGVPLRCSAFERGSASNSVTICGKSVANGMCGSVPPLLLEPHGHRPCRNANRVVPEATNCVANKGAAPEAAQRSLRRDWPELKALQVSHGSRNGQLKHALLAPMNPFNIPEGPSFGRWPRPPAPTGTDAPSDPQPVVGFRISFEANPVPHRNSYMSPVWRSCQWLQPCRDSTAAQQLRARSEGR
jgi:hypothetical protein